MVMCWEDNKIFDILDRMALCQECYAPGTGGHIFGCDSCLTALARGVMDT